MATKTYQAESMLDALKQVQKDLGPDAIVLSVRDVQVGPSWQMRRKQGVEIVAMTPDMLPKGDETGPKAARPEPLLRQSADGKTIEFVDDSRSVNIEWAGANPAGVRRSGAAADGEAAGAGKGARKWQPKHMTRDEMSAANRAALFRGDVSVIKQDEAAEAFSDEPEPPTRAAAAEPAPSAPDAPLPEAARKLYQQLLGQGVDPEYVDRLARVAGEVSPAAVLTEARLKDYLARQLEAELHILPRSASAVANPIIVLIGMSGSGKTSMIAKLAYYYSHLLGKKVIWASADTVRTGAIAETRSYTDALGVPLHLVYTADDFKVILAEKADADLILVDTPGYNPYCEQQMVDLGAILTEIPNRATYLVASATTKETDLNQAIASLGLFSIKGLIFTKLDETCTYGSLYNLARKSRLPLAFFSTGKEASSSLYFADGERLVGALLGKGWTK